MSTNCLAPRLSWKRSMTTRSPSGSAATGWVASNWSRSATSANRIHDSPATIPKKDRSAMLGPISWASTSPKVRYLDHVPIHDEDAICRAVISRSVARSLDRSDDETDSPRPPDSKSIAASSVLLDHFRPRDVVRIHACTARSSVVACRPSTRAVPRLPFPNARCTVRRLTPAICAASATVNSMQITSHERRFMSINWSGTQHQSHAVTPSRLSRPWRHAPPKTTAANGLLTTNLVALIVLTTVYQKNAVWLSSHEPHRQMDSTPNTMVMQNPPRASM